MDTPEKSHSMGQYTYHPMAMHLHTCHQPGASMESQIYRAHELGMQYIRISDHDVRTGPKQLPADDFDFTRGVMEIDEGSRRFRRWEHAPDSPETLPEVRFDGKAMGVSAPAGAPVPDWETMSRLQLFASGKRHTVSLLAEVTLQLTLRFVPTADTRLILDIRLSQRPPEMIPGHLWYVLGELPERLPPHTACISLPGDGAVTLPLSQDVPKALGGEDNVFDTVILTLQRKNGAAVSMEIEALRIAHRLGFEAVVQKQRALAAEIGASYGVHPFVTTEISDAGNHKGCLSTCVPVLDYAAAGYQITNMEAVRHVQRHGGIFAWNHPFEVYKRQTFLPGELEALIPRHAAELIANRVYGASAMEIGFVESRPPFTLQHHLRLWDLLSLAGIFITGYGDSDSHDSRIGWFDGNNFVAWIAAPEDCTFPVPEQAFLDSLEAGRVFTGDPARFDGRLCFTTRDGAQMGTVHKDRAVELTFSCWGKAGWQCRIILDGVCEQAFPLTGGFFSHDFTLETRHTVSFARCELYDETGRCISLTNPVYVVRSDEFRGEIPTVREVVK